MNIPQEDPGYFVHELETALDRIAELASSEEGREGLAGESRRLIEVQRRLYALMWSLSLVIKNAA